MMKRNLTVEKYVILFLLGGLSYYNIEIMYRGYSHISMLICGGLSLILIGGINQAFGKELSLVAQMFLGSVIITTLELVTGLIVNKWMGLQIWDYSDMPFNLWGQVCLLYSFIWFFLSGLCIYLDDWVRVKVFGETKPHYHFL